MTARRRSAWVAALALAGALEAGRAPGAEVDCLIQPNQDVTVSAAIEGVVEEVLVERGDTVARGDVVARLESSVERASVSVARARAEARGRVESSKARVFYATRELGRQLRLQEQDVASQSDMDEAESVKQIAEAELLEAEENKKIARHELERTQAALDRRTIRSPVNGVVVEHILEAGEYADPPQLMRIAEIDPLRVEVFAPLELYGRIAVEDEAEILPEEPVGGAYTARVTVVDPVIDAASGTFGVRLELPNPDHALPAGLNCRVRFADTGAGGSGPAPPAEEAPAE